MKTANEGKGRNGWPGPVKCIGVSGSLQEPSMDTSRNQAGWKGAWERSLCKDQVGALGASKGAVGGGQSGSESTSMRHGTECPGGSIWGKGGAVRAGGGVGPTHPPKNAAIALGLRARRSALGSCICAAGFLQALGCMGPAPAVDEWLARPAHPTLHRGKAPLSVESEQLSAELATALEPKQGKRSRLVRRNWKTILDVQRLDRWQAGVFGDSDELDLASDGVILPIGVPLTGITYLDEPPSGSYALEVEATRQYGTDFFLGVTFPVRDEHVTLVLGGWGGTLCGLSCIDGDDASNNGTRTHVEFPNGKRQTVLIEVDGSRVVALVNGDELVNVDLTGKRLEVRNEVLPSVPLGLSSFATCTVVHRVRVAEGSGEATVGPISDRE